MKKACIFLLFVLMTEMVSARQISETEARAIAASKVVGMKKAARVQSKGISQSVSEAPVYLFNSPNGGFAIVAGDDRMPNMVLAYSETSTLNLDNCAPAMKAWLEEMSAFIAAGDFSRVSSPSLDYSKPVAPLITTKWDQDEPYNRLTPLGATGKHCYTGCAATAMAQVVNYWQWPKEGGLTEHSYDWNGQTLSVDFRESRYDWANMADVYDASSTEAQRNAVAKLMWDCGVACDMIYGEEMSSALSLDVAKGLADYLGYSTGLRVRFRDYTPDDEWFAMVNAELDAAQPVLYCAMTPEDEGHAFICDGYDEAGLYHINWGWSGMCDGYYDLSTLEPVQQGSGGAASGQGFSVQQQIITGVRPAEEGDVAAGGWELVLADFDIQPDDEDGETFSLEWYICNLGYRPFAGSIVLSLSRDGAPDETIEEVLQQVSADDALLPNIEIQLYVPGLAASELADGVYRMELKALDEYTQQYIPLLLPNKCPPMRFEIKDGKINVDYRSYLDIKLTEIDEVGFYYTSGNMRYTVADMTLNIENTSDIWFTGNLAVTVSYPDDAEDTGIEETYALTDLPNIGPGEAYEITTPVQYRVGGKVKVSIESYSLSEEEEAEEVVFEGNAIEFDADDSYYELALAEVPEVTEDEGVVTITAQVGCCTGDVNLEEGLSIDTEAVTEREVICSIYNAESNQLAATAKTTFFGTWEETKTLTFKTAEPLENGDYQAVLSYQSAPDADGNVLTLILGDEVEDFSGISFSVTASPIGTGIDGVDVDILGQAKRQSRADVDIQNRRYNLLGQPVGSDYKGIVIQRSMSGRSQGKYCKKIVKQ